MNSLLLHRDAGYHAVKAAACLGLLLILCVIPAPALMPEPYTLYYGQAKGPGGELLNRESDAEVIVRIDGRENTRYRIEDILTESVNYYVRVKVDDGNGYLYNPTAAREGDIPEIVIRSEGVEYGVEDEIPPVAGRGAVNSVDIEAVPEPCAVIFIWLAMMFLARAYRTEQR